jgi:starch synthase (maltosyl-transferring)
VPISLVITDLDVGGAERALVALATRIDRRRWRPSVIGLSPEGRLAEPLRAAGIETECLDVSRRRPIHAVWQLVKSLRRHTPRLVQSFLFHANVAARLAAPLAGRPWVVSGLRVAEHQKRWHLLLDRRTAHLAVGSVCVSQGVLRFSRDVGGANPERLRVIGNGVDLLPFDRAEPRPRREIGVPDDAQLILCVGRLDVQKGLSILLEAAEQVVALRPDWHLVIVGDGPERDRLQRRVAESPPLRNRVHWLGRSDEVPSLLKSADLLVLPSLWEGMPNVVLEAMAARRAVVATAVEGSEDLVTPGQTGWLVPPADPEALCQALLDAAADPVRRKRFGEAGRARVEADFSLGGMIDAYERLWAGILGLEYDRPNGQCPTSEPPRRTPEP